jgi:toxin-antitoxin system PIN domain toxin
VATVILVDVNILLYAVFSDSREHGRIAPWFTERLRRSERVGIPWHAILGFLRIATNKKVFNKPLTMHDAWEAVGDWLALPNVWIPLPGDRHAAILSTLLKSTQLYGELVSDAHLAALAIEHGLSVCSVDRDFARFPGLRWEDPLAAALP